MDKPSDKKPSDSLSNEDKEIIAKASKDKKKLKQLNLEYNEKTNRFKSTEDKKFVKFKEVVASFKKLQLQEDIETLPERVDQLEENIGEIKKDIVEIKKDARKESKLNEKKFNKIIDSIKSLTEKFKDLKNQEKALEEKYQELKNLSESVPETTDATRVNPKDAEAEKSVLNGIYDNFVEINNSFKNVLKSLSEKPAIETNATKVEEEPEKDKPGKVKRRKAKSNFLSALGLALFAFSPAIVRFLRENPEKLGEMLQGALKWMTEDLPKFFKEGLPKIVNDAFSEDMLKHISGIQILQAAGLLLLLPGVKGTIIKMILQALTLPIRAFLPTLLKFLISPAGLVILAGAGAGMWIGKKINDLMKEGEERAGERLRAEEVADTSRKDELVKRFQKTGLLAGENISSDKLKAYIQQMPPGELKVLEKKLEDYESTSDKNIKAAHAEFIFGEKGLNLTNRIMGDVGENGKELGFNFRTGQMEEEGSVYAQAKKKKADKMAAGKTGSMQSVTEPDMTSVPSPVAREGGVPLPNNDAKLLTPSEMAAEREKKGTELTKQTMEVTKPKAKPKASAPVIMAPSTGSRPVIKPGQPWDVNNVPDPSPFFGSLAEQLFMSPQSNYAR
jgi:hypothetical protein